MDYLDVKKTYETEFNTMKEKMRILGEDFFKNRTKKFFEDFPTVTSFSWTQYTPYFNDGDVCEFGVYNDYLVYTEDGQEYEDVYYSKYYEDRGENLFENKVAKALDSIITVIDEDTMKFMFGDHVRVTVNRDNTVVVDDYSHD